MSRLLIIFGILLVIVGIAWPLLKKIGLGHLPGDIIIRKESFTLYFPITTCIVISLLITFILWLLNR